MGVQAWNRGAIHMQISRRVVVGGGIAIGDGGLKYGWVGGGLSWGVGGGVVLFVFVGAVRC